VATAAAGACERYPSQKMARSGLFFCRIASDNAAGRRLWTHHAPSGGAGLRSRTRDGAAASPSSFMRCPGEARAPQDPMPPTVDTVSGPAASARADRSDTPPLALRWTPLVACGTPPLLGRWLVGHTLGGCDTGRASLNLVATGVARGDMAPQGGRPAQGDGAQRPLLRAREGGPIAAQKGVAMLAHHIGDFEWRPTHGTCSRWAGKARVRKGPCVAWRAGWATWREILVERSVV
jgi:hypothetical protein